MFTLLVGLLVANIMPPPLDARAIYLRAREALNAVRLPDYIAFTYQDRSTGDVGRAYHTFGSGRLRIVVRLSDGHAFVQTLRLSSGYQGRIAPVVVGDNAIFPNTGVYRLGDFPTAAFGLRRGSSRPDFLGAAPSAPLPSGHLRIIASVTAIGIPYDVTRLADDVIEGRPMYHVGLRPLRDPKHNVLREMWVDRTTFQPRRFRAIRNVGRPVLFNYLVTIDNSLIGGYLINTSLFGQFDRPLFSVEIGGDHVVDPRARELTTYAAWTISDVSFPETLPDWLFNPDTFAAHSQDALPAALSAIGIPPTLPILRHLVFTDRIDARAPQPEATAPEATAPEATAPEAAVTVDVVAASEDGELVVDAGPTEDTSAPVARVAISSDGDLAYDSRVHFAPEITALLKLLGRKVIGPDARQRDETWTIHQTDNDRTSVAAFSLTDDPTPGNEAIRIDDRTAARKRNTTAHVLDGLIDYDPTLLVPKHASFVIQNSDGTAEDDRSQSEAIITLRQDSFSNRVLSGTSK